MTSNIEKRIKQFWRNEIIASETYNFLQRKAKKSKKETYKKFSTMEKSHAQVWNHIAEKEYNKKYQRTIFLNLQIIFMKILVLVIPLPIIVNYLEFEERTAIIDYSRMLEVFDKKSPSHGLIEKIIRDEILHENSMIEFLLDKLAYMKKSRQAIHGFILALINVFAILLGLFVVFPSNPESVLITGLITIFGGGFVAFASTLISSRSQKEISDGRITEIHIKQEMHPDALKEDLKNSLMERGIHEETTIEILEIIGDDPIVLSNLVKSIKLTEGTVPPATSALITSGLFLLGGLPVIIPFIFPLFLSNFTLVIALIISSIIAVILSMSSGVIVAILSGKRMILKALENLVIIIISSGMTFVIGYLIRILITV